MKKILALLLVLVMLVPMVLATHADEADVEIRPFSLVNWSYPKGDYTDGCSSANSAIITIKSYIRINYIQIFYCGAICIME